MTVPIKLRGFRAPGRAQSAAAPSTRRAFGAGIAFAVVALIAGRSLIRNTTVADRFVSPLLVADTQGSADAIVVLGAGNSGDCLPNLAGIQRVLLAARMFRSGRAPVVVISGGPAEAACPIATAMQRLAVEIGLPPARVFVETGALSTRENAERTAPLLTGLGATRLLVVTDRLHLSRASRVFEAMGFAVERAAVPLYAHAPDNVALAISGVREYVAVAYYLIRGWLSPGAPPAVRDIEVETRTPVVRTVTNPAGPIAILGASYAEGWQLRDIDGVPVVNLGVGGQQSFEMRARFERDVVPLRPRAVILWGFINDVFRAPAGGREQSLERVRESYRAMVDLARQHGIEPILTTEITLASPAGWRERLSSILLVIRDKEGFQDVVNRQVIDINRWLVDLAHQEGLMILDLHAALAEPGGRRRREFVDGDGTHVSPAGYAALTNFARPLLEKHVITR